MCSNCKPSKNECSCEKKHGCCKRKCCEPKPKNCGCGCCEHVPMLMTNAKPVHDNRGVSGGYGNGANLTQSYGIIY
jgi:hypothetical protein